VFLEELSHLGFVCADFEAFIDGRNGLLFKTRNGTPYLHNSLEARWLTPRLKAMGLDEPGMGWHALKRFRKTWLRGKRCQDWRTSRKTMAELLFPSV
jgi:hypothetical protein